MALDKQKILNDLGSVMNQLQSADCGCMGKLFSNPGQAQGNSAQGYGFQQGCCRNQMYGHPCSGEPYSANQQGMPMQGRPCMGYCNPPKLYADTYSYLNQNLMQPVVREVYDDLKSISPANAVMNDPMGNQLGLAQGAPKSPVVRGNLGQVVGQNPIGNENAMHNMGGMTAGNAINSMSMGGQQQNPTGGMGAEILKMMMKSNKSQPMNMAGQGGEPPTQGDTNAHQTANAVSMGGTAQYNASNMGAHHVQYDGGNMGGNYAQYQTGQMRPANMAEGNAQSYNPSTQYMTQSVTPQVPMTTHTGGNVQGNNMPPPSTGNINANPGGQQMPTAQHGNYGQHAAGIAKFNEMFPGVMQGLGGELNFDPMSIAIQMNPANKQQVAMDTMQKLMTGNSGKNVPLDANAAAMKPVMNGMNAVNANFNPNQVAPSNQPQPVSYSNQARNADQQQLNNNSEVAANQQYQMQQQIVNNPVSDAPTNQPIPQQQTYEEQPQSVQSAGGVGLPDRGYPNQSSAPYQHVAKEPIYPVDTSKYNTLGQPIERLPTKPYERTDYSLPQTLSPQPVPSKLRTNQGKPSYSNVKASISKTSLFGNKPVGNTPTRRQLQQVYNQYKGSLSNTDQNIRTPVQAGQGHHYSGSDGRINVNQSNLQPQRQVPMERTGGDTIANNQVVHEQMTYKGDHGINETGDVAANKPMGDTAPAEKSMSPIKNANLRNGLQDMVYTSYPQSAAWSFHGHTERMPYSASYRFRNRV